MAVSALFGAEGALAAPAKAPAAGPQQPKQAPASAADIASARVAARLYGKRVEALSERTETSTTWVNKDGSLTSELAAGPIRFRDAATGDWRDVDVELAAAPNGSVVSKAHPRGLRLSGKAGAKAASLQAAQSSPATDLVTLGQGDEAITLQWRGGLPAPKLDGTRATYENAVPGADVVVEATRTGFEQFVEVQAKPAAGFSYTLPLRTKGLKVEQQADGSVLFTDKKSKKTATMPAPVMWDATVDKVSGEHTRRAKVGLKVVKAKGGVDLVVTPDAEFLADPATKYPVTVDPSTAALSNVFDTYVQQGETVDWSNDTELDLGNPGTKNADNSPRTARSFITWNTAPVADALVMDAKLSLWNFHSANTDCVAYPWDVWSTGASSTSSRWTAQPAWNAKKATSTETVGNPACTAAPDGWINANVTTLVQEWASAKAPLGHMGLRAPDETVVPQWKRVNSANAAANPPKLTVTYNYRPKTGTRQEAGPPFFSYGGDYVVNTATPTLRDTFVDANGDKVNGTFQIFDSVTDTQVGSVIASAYVPSGQTAQVTVPAGVLTNGKTYKFRTSPHDGTHYNLTWSGWKTFTVDTAAPAAPTGITSTDYPSNAWVKGGGQAGTFTVTPNGTDHHWIEWSLDGITWTRVATGGSSAPKAVGVVPPEDGTHTLQVRSVDKADNTSTATAYTFHAGPGGFDSPRDGERTARRIPLIADADASKYDAVSFSWRRAETDAWTQIPAGHVTVGGQTLTAWPIALTAGKNAPAVWDAATTVDPDGTVQIKADFTGPDSASGSSDPLTAVIDRDADSGATTPVGPGALNLLTGDFEIAGTEMSYFGLQAARTASSREPGAGGTLAGQAAIFGDEWVSGTVVGQSETQYTTIRKTSDTSLDIVLQDGTGLYFTAKAGDPTAWVPEPGGENLSLSGTFATGFTLRSSEGAEVKFAKLSAGSDTWQVVSSDVAGSDNSRIQVVSEEITVNGKKLARPTRVIAAGGAVAQSTCVTTPSTAGCRVLEFEYATATTAAGSTLGDYAGQVKSIKLWSTEKAASAATARAVQAYAYDADGRLREAWNPQITPALKTAYGYDSAGRVTQITLPGQEPWSLTYGSGGQAGMLVKATRARLKAGTAATTEGESVTSVVYDVPLSGSSAPYTMSPAEVAKWGQSVVPTDATAVFASDSVPSSHTGGALAAGDYGRAVIRYLDASGTQVNTVDEAGGIATNEKDAAGNTVRELTAGNRALAMGVTDEQKARLADLGIGALSTAERAELLSSTSVYDAEGTRRLEEFGALRRVDLTEDFKDGSTVIAAAGTSVIARPWTVNTFDQGRPTDGSAVISDQKTLVTVGARVRGYDSLMAGARVTKTQYDWVKGKPTAVTQDPGGLDLVTTTSYDADGRVTAVVPPGSNGTDAAARVTTFWSTGTGVCKGRPEWVGLACSTGPAGAITGGGGNPAETATTTTEYGFYGQIAQESDTANGVTRERITSYDNAGRITGTQVTGGVGTAVSASSVTYNTGNGLVETTTSATGGTVTTAYDKLGRLISYTDADGGVTTTEYDGLNRPAKVSDSVPSTVTYGYDHTKERRGLVTSVTDSVAGTFTADYDVDGVVTKQTLPGGYTMTQTGGPGQAQQRTYTRTSDGTVLLSDAVRQSVRGDWTSHEGGAGTGESQAYTYDAVGRLAQVADTYDNVCTTRTYTFDKRANRTALATAVAAPSASCTTGGATSVTHAYDSADRLVDTGYTYDALGRTTAMPGGTSIAYHSNDLVQRQTTGNSRKTWTLDATGRFRGRTAESNATGTWTSTGSETNHYGGPTDSPRWIKNNTSGSVTRMVSDLAGALSATTTATGGTVLQFGNLHGDVVLQLPLDGSAPTALSSDEYGRKRGATTGARYGWLGSHQRSADTPSGAILMGVRLYNPDTGRFLSVDPVYGGNSNAYEYCRGNPVTCKDLDGAYSYSFTYYVGWYWSSASTIFSWIRNHFWVFPLRGCGGTLSRGETCWLTPVLGPVLVESLGSNYWVFKSLPGHLEGPGKRLQFSITRWNGFVELNATAWGSDSTRCNRNGICSTANKISAWSGFYTFSKSIKYWTAAYGVW